MPANEPSGWWLPNETARVANIPVTLSHEIDGLLTISKIQNLLEKVILGSRIMYGKLNEFKMQFMHSCGKITNLITLF